MNLFSGGLEPTWRLQSVLDEAFGDSSLGERFVWNHGVLCLMSDASGEGIVTVIVIPV